MKHVLLAVAAALMVTSAHAGDAADDEWQLASDTEIICMPMRDIFQGISSPQELSRMIPQYTGQTLYVDYASDRVALFMDRAERYPPRILIQGREHCLAMLRRMRTTER